MIQYLDIPTLLNFRLLNRSTYELISTYERSITMEVKKSAWHTVPMVEPTYLSVSTIRDLARLNIARQLAVQAVQSEQTLKRTAAYFQFHGFEPDDAMANDMRDSVTKGFMILYLLCQIQTIVAKEYLSGRDTLADRIRKKLTTEPTQLHKAKELLLQQVWQEYWDSLSADDLVDFRLMTKTLRGKLLFDRVGLEVPLPSKVTLWAFFEAETHKIAQRRFAGYLLREGPAFIKQLWSQDQVVAATAIQCFRRTMKRRPRKTIALEGETICRLFVSRAYPPPSHIYIGRDTAEAASACYAALFHVRESTLSSDTSREEQLKTRRRAINRWRFIKMIYL